MTMFLLLSGPLVEATVLLYYCKCASDYGRCGLIIALTSLPLEVAKKLLGVLYGAVGIPYAYYCLSL